MEERTPTHTPRDSSNTVLYKVIAEHLETFLATLDADPTAKGLPQSVKDEFYAYLQCGILAHGFLRLGCDTCQHEMLLAFSCKRRGFCPSCAGRRMAQTAAHLVEQVIPWVATQQWVVSYPDLASPEAGLRATSHCPGPPSPRNICVRRRPRQRGPIGEVRAAAAHLAPSHCEMPFEIALPSFPETGRHEAAAPANP
jgi:hypothetical protein